MKKLLLIVALLCTFPAIAKKEKTSEEKMHDAITKVLKPSVEKFAQAAEIPYTNDPTENQRIKTIKEKYDHELKTVVTIASHIYGLEKTIAVQLDLYEKYINRNQARA